MSAQNFDDEADVYYNVNNDLFYYIDPDTDTVVHTTEGMANVLPSAHTKQEFLSYISPKNSDCTFIKV